MPPAMNPARCPAAKISAVLCVESFLMKRMWISDPGMKRSVYPMRRANFMASRGIRLWRVSGRHFLTVTLRRLARSQGCPPCSCSRSDARACLRSSGRQRRTRPGSSSITLRSSRRRTEIRMGQTPCLTLAEVNLTNQCSISTGQVAVSESASMTTCLWRNALAADGAPVLNASAVNPTAERMKTRLRRLSVSKRRILM